MQNEMEYRMEATRKDAVDLTKQIGIWVGVRGALALIFGVLLLAFPGISLAALVLTFGALAFVDGVVQIVTAARAPKGTGRGWILAQGILGVVTGVVVWLWPDLSALALLYVIGGWAVVLGGLQIGASVSLPLDGGDRVLLILSGLLGIAFGTIMFVAPGAGALALLTLIAAFAIGTGITMIVTAFKIRSRTKDIVSLWSEKTATAA